MPVEAATSILGAQKQANAANAAGSEQAGAAREALGLQQSIYNDQKANQAPWMQAGTTALGGMQNPDFQRDFTMADFQKDPGYDFRMQQGQQALERSASAQGALQSGAQLKALTQYGQDFASNEYQNAYNRFNNDRNQRFGRLSTIAGMGQNATNALGMAGMNYANQGGQDIMGAGNAMAAAHLGVGQAWANGVNGVNHAYERSQDNMMKMGGMMMGGM